MLEIMRVWGCCQCCHRPWSCNIFSDRDYIRRDVVRCGVVCGWLWNNTEICWCLSYLFCKTSCRWRRPVLHSLGVVRLQTWPHPIIYVVTLCCQTPHHLSTYLNHPITHGPVPHSKIRHAIWCICRLVQSGLTVTVTIVSSKNFLLFQALSRHE